MTVAKPTAPVEPAVRLAEARIELDSLLMNGGDTTAIRSVITTIEAEIADSAAAQATERAEVEHQRQAAITERASAIAAAAGARAAATLVGLEPPAPPL